MELKKNQRDKYSFRIRWSDEDDEYLATVPEFPGLSAFGETIEEALAEARVALEGFIETYEARGIALPEPATERVYSGQVRLRLPRDLHARAAAMAEEHGVSLNNYLTTAAAARLGAESYRKDLIDEIVTKVIGLLRDELCVRTAITALSAAAMAISPPNIGVQEPEGSGSSNRFIMVCEGGVLTMKERDIHGRS